MSLKQEINGNYIFYDDFFKEKTGRAIDDLKVNLINSESDKIWFSKKESSDFKIDKCRKERFSKYL
jgi:hypothetical protein